MDLALQKQFLLQVLGMHVAELLAVHGELLEPLKQ
jgi:hypothetical protein